MVEVCTVFCYCILYLERIDVCIGRVFAFLSVVVTVWGSVGECLLCRGCC